MSEYQARGLNKQKDNYEKTMKDIMELGRYCVAHQITKADLFKIERAKNDELIRESQNGYIK